MRRNFTLAAAVAAAGVAALPGGAQAAAIATDASCYIAGQTMGISGSGFAPGSNWSIKTTASSNQIFEFGQTDLSGNFSATATAPSLGSVIGPASRTFTLTGLQDEAQVATSTFRVANFAASVSPTRGKPTQRGTWKFSGFTVGKPVYIHVRRNAKQVGNFRFGVAAAPCGTLTKVAKRLPVPTSRIKNGTYQLYFDSSPTYKPTTRPQVRYTTTVFTTFR